ncbi:internal virion protein [Pseudomonas phage Henninger]|uniref:Protein inside capsid A n=1 Tax=Pseudomonas phage Henninger TaxID=2079287 RepID=A0A2K9VH57_9CAUD|nr:internal virion protein [Pseudomonas phage Henninger]AUV61696.1 protein inside capsid A [Pseudomonas phage Henninger]
MKLEFVKGTRDILTVAAGNLCASDLSEFHMHIPNRNPLDVLPECLDGTTVAICAGSIVLAVGGSRGCLWFVTTHYVDQLSRAEKLEFFKMLKVHLKWCRKGNPNHLTNYVSVVNTPHIRLLNALGAEWADEITMSPAGFAFRQFWL